MKTYYFSHDIKARTDRKSRALRKKYGSSGYGIYWMIIEALADEYTFALELSDENYELFSDDFGCEISWLKEFIDDCIKKFKLFNSDGKYFWSESLLERMALRDKTIQARIEAGILGGIKSGESRRRKSELGEYDKKPIKTMITNG